MDPDHSDALELLEYRALYERSAVPTLTIDHARRQIIHVNAAALKMLGLSVEQVLGRPGTDFLLKPSQDHLGRIRALRGDETAMLMDVPTALGVRTVELNIVPAGAEGVAFVELLDVTDLLEAATRAEVNADELGRTATALTTVASRLSHDLRGPMTSIAGFANLLVNDDVVLDDNERAELLRRISANTTALAAMAGSILGEADTGAIRPEDDSHQAEDLFRIVRGVTEAQLAECGATLETRSEITTLPVAVGAIRQAVINLVSNSVKYRDPARPLKVEIEIRTGHAGIEIAVRDNGKGLSEDSAPLFEAGVRGPAAEGTTGAGLGLAFVRAGVESIGGSVTAGPLDPGAQFVIVLPLPQAEPPPPPPGPSAERRGITAPQYERIIDLSPVPAFVVDIALREIVAVNRAAVALLGLDDADILGRPGSDFVDEQAIADGLRRRVLDAPDARSPLRTRVRAVRGDVPVSIWIAPVEGTSLAVAQAVVDEPATSDQTD